VSEPEAPGHGAAWHGQPRRLHPRPQWIAVTPASARRTAMTVALVGVGLLIALWVFSSVSSFLFLLLLAWLLSIAMEPMVLWLGRHGIGRRLAAGLTMILLILVIVGIGALFGQLFRAQLEAAQQALPGAVKATLEWVNSTFRTKLNPDSILTSLQLTPDKLAQLASKYGGGVLGIFGSVVTVIVDLLTILVFAYYLSADSIALRQLIGSYLPPKYQPVLLTVWTIAVQKTGGFVASKAVLALISAAAHAAFFWLIDVPFWLPLGVLAGIVGQFIPTIGTYIGILLPAVFAITVKPLTVVWIILFATVYQQIENYVLTPRISRRTMDIHPAVALGSVFVGAGLFGPIGAIIGIPVAAAILAILETFRKRHELLPELADLAEADEPPPDYPPEHEVPGSSPGEPRTESAKGPST
jgi:predicted PurR-regulated permease PerM